MRVPSEHPFLSGSAERDFSVDLMEVLEDP